VSDGGSLGFRLPPVAYPRHLYARAVGIRGHVQLRSQYTKSIPVTPVVTRDQRVWVDLGELPPGESQAEISVIGGKAAVIRIALATPSDMAALKSSGSSGAGIGLRGNGGLAGTGDVTVSHASPEGLSSYLIVRSSADGFWSLDGRDADGTYAGYGQLYRIGSGESTLRSVLRGRVAVGGGLSALVTVGLLLAIARPWLGRRFRRPNARPTGSRP
jgi:hypothetical protein